MNPEVAIMMPVYNGMPYIQDSVRSILRQAYDNWHCIICDDGSTDSTLEYLRTLEFDPRFTILHNERNMGRGIARQRILDESSAPYVCMLDAGDLMHPDRVALQVDYLESHPDVGIVSSGMLSFGNTTDVLRVRGFGNGEINGYCGRSRDLVCFAPSMFRTAIAKKDGVGFGTMKLCEDTYFLSRYFACNPRYYSIPQPLYYYNEFDDLSKRDMLLSYLQGIGISFRPLNLKMIVINLAKFGISLLTLPFMSMQKRAFRRGRPATAQEAEEFRKNL